MVTKYIFADYKEQDELAFFNTLSHPKIFEAMAIMYPNLKICLSHFGGDVEWENYLQNAFLVKEDNWFYLICELLRNYDNIYADISFTLNNPKFWPLLKVLIKNPDTKKKILFGTDFYLVETESTEREFSIGLRTFLGEDFFWQIANKNPKVFFETKNPNTSNKRIKKRKAHKKGFHRHARKTKR